MTKIRINITKDILQKSRMCSTRADNCAFALAVRDLFSGCAVGTKLIYPFFDNATGSDIQFLSFPITEEMTAFIKRFDKSSPEEIDQMEEQSFELEIPDWAIEQMDISDVHQILAES